MHNRINKTVETGHNWQELTMKKTPDPVRIGVLGCGMISQAAHFESCQKVRNARLYAVCDAADDLRSRMASQTA